ncbi:MAG: hypothetical protein JO326_01670 [Acetobacteraceae bacterium]|nr:hypothetical protein [Acetobacteraceae bacterium]
MITGFAASDAVASDLPRLSKPFRRADLIRAVAEQVENAKVLAPPARAADQV